MKSQHCRVSAYELDVNTAKATEGTDADPNSSAGGYITTEG